MYTLMASTMGTILAGLLIGSSLPAGPSPTHPPSPSVLFSQIIESNPKPPTEDKQMRPSEEMPKPRIEQNPTPPTEKQSMRTAGRLA